MKSYLLISGWDEKEMNGKIASWAQAGFEPMPESLRVTFVEYPMKKDIKPLYTIILKKVR